MTNFIIDQDKSKNPEEFYVSLKEKLTELHNFPEDFLYKFIIPSSEQKMIEIYQVFDGVKTTITNRDSKNGKYVSVTINAFVLDADHVVKLYKEVAKIEGIIML